MNANPRVGFEALVSYEALQDSGQKLQFDMLHRMRIMRPERLFWVTLHDNAAVDSAWFDSGTFTLLKQPANVWGRIELPADIPRTRGRIMSPYENRVATSRYGFARVTSRFQCACALSSRTKSHNPAI
jgi:hypothetical protein